MELTTEEAQKFWPVYNEFQREIKKLKEEARQNGRCEKDFSDAEAEVFLNVIFDTEQNKLNLKKEYSKRMEAAISKAKIAKLYTIENKFRDNIYRSIKRRMKDRGEE